LGRFGWASQLIISSEAGTIRAKRTITVIGKKNMIASSDINTSLEGSQTEVVKEPISWLFSWLFRDEAGDALAKAQSR
jgi:hypothetical protein